MPISHPQEKKDAVRPMDGKDQKTNSTKEESILNSTKTQYNAFKIVKAKGVIFTQSTKNALKQIFGCRFNYCYDAYVGPIAKKNDVQEFLNQLKIDATLSDVCFDFEKNQKIDGLETRLNIIEQNIQKLFEEFIVLAERYDPTRSYHDFQTEPASHNPNQSNDDIRFQVEWDLYQRFINLRDLEKERENLRVSINLHIQEEIGWHDPNPIYALPIDVPEFLPKQMLPYPFDEWVLDEAYRMPCPPDYVAIASIVSLGGIIGARCGIKPKAFDNWIVVPNLWGGLVGVPSTKKSPAISVALKPLEKLIHIATEKYQKAIETYSVKKTINTAQKEALEIRIKKAAKDQNLGELETLAAELKEHEFKMQLQTPILKRYKTNDTTIEKLGELLRDNPSGMLVVRDELIGLLASWEKEGREGDRAFYLEGWNGYSSFDTDRIQRGNINIPNICISLLGGIQPDKLLALLIQTSKALSNDGMLQRFQLLVYPNHNLWEWRDRIPNKEIRAQVDFVFQKIGEFNPLDWGAISSSDVKIPYFQLDQEAQVIFIDWISTLRLKKLPQEDNPLILQHLEKYDKLFASLALIFHLITCIVNDSKGPINAVSAKKAVEWCGYLEAHARRCYGLLADDGLHSALALCEKLRKGKLKEGFTVRDVRRNQWTYLTSDDSIKSALNWLEEEKWLRSYETGGDGPGKGPRTCRYKINPKVFLHKSDG